MRAPEFLLVSAFDEAYAPPPVPDGGAGVRTFPTRVAERLVPEEPRLCGVVLSERGEERRISATRVPVHRCARRADAREELVRSLVFWWDRHRKVYRGFDCAPGAGCGQVPGGEPDMRGKARIGLDRRE